MKTLFNIINVFLLNYLLQQSAGVLGQECNSAGLRKFDSNMANLLTIGVSGRRFPESTGSELKTFCSQTTKYADDIDSYRNRCMKDAAKQSAGVLIYAVKNAIKQMCGKDTKRVSKLIQTTPCLNQGNSEINKCYTKMIDSLLGAQNEPDDKKKIPMLCCQYFKVFTCIQNGLERVKICDENKITMSLDFVRSLSGNFVDLFCGDYTEGSDKCSKLGSPPKKRKDQRRAKSFAVPMLQLMESFRDQ